MGAAPLTLFRNQSQPKDSQFRSFLLGLWGLVCLLSGWCLPSSEYSAIALSQWQFNPKTHQFQFQWKSDIEPRTFILNNPTRIVIDLPETELGQKPIHKTYPGLVNEVRIAQFQPTTTRIVLELAPDADLSSETAALTQNPAAEGNQWQLTPNIQKKTFSLSKLMELPPADPNPPRGLNTTVQVPELPITKLNYSSSKSQTELSLASGRKLILRYRGESPLKLKVGQPWQEVLFLEQKLTDDKGQLIAPAQTPVIGRFQTTAQGTRFIIQALITTLEPKTSSKLESVIPLQGRSSLFPAPTQSSHLNQITIPPNTVFTVKLTEDWHYKR